MVNIAIQPINNYKKVIPRARLGFIISASNRMVEQQIQKLCREGIIPHFARAGITNCLAAPLENTKSKNYPSSRLLGD